MEVLCAIDDEVVSLLFPTTVDTSSSTYAADPNSNSAPHISDLDEATEFHAVNGAGGVPASLVRRAILERLRRRGDIPLATEPLDGDQDQDQDDDDDEERDLDLITLYCGPQTFQGDDLVPLAPEMVLCLVAEEKGGKGGLGTLLKGAGRKMGKGTTNFGACRDLSGRRLRHVNDEIALKEYHKEQVCVCVCLIWLLSVWHWHWH